MWIVTLWIDEHIADKIETKHGVTFEEAEEACSNQSAHHEQRTRAGLTMLYSRTLAGRYLLVVLA